MLQLWFLSLLINLFRFPIEMRKGKITTIKEGQVITAWLKLSYLNILMQYAFLVITTHECTKCDLDNPLSNIQASPSILNQEIGVCGLKMESSVLVCALSRPPES